MTQSVKLRFFESRRHTCGYLHDRDAINVFADPRAIMTGMLYSRLIDRGFRRSGAYVYRPHCPGCSACVPTRILADDFRPNRSQRRNRAANRDLHVTLLEPEYRAAHFNLYRRYIKARHGGGEMDNPTPESFADFLVSDWMAGLFIEFRLGTELVCVAIVDTLPQGLSSVYTFFEPRLTARGLGTYALLWQIEEAARRGLPYVYPGYWIENHPKMGYKTGFQPIEGLIDGQWRPLARKS